MIYVGRVDTNKGCEEMQEFFERYVRETGNSDLSLVILGQKFMKIHKHAQIFYLGFVSEEDKFDGIAEQRHCGCRLNLKVFLSLCWRLWHYINRLLLMGNARF